MGGNEGSKGNLEGATLRQKGEEGGEREPHSNGHATKLEQARLMRVLKDGHQKGRHGKSLRSVWRLSKLNFQLRRRGGFNDRFPRERIGESLNSA